MRFTRVSVRLTAVCAAVLGLGLATASPALAESGTWRAYGNTNPVTSSSSRWACHSSVAVAVNVIAQSCAIRSRDLLLRPGRDYRAQ